MNKLSFEKQCSFSPAILGFLKVFGVTIVMSSSFLGFNFGAYAQPHPPLGGGDGTNG
jgi:hypothetical protein